MKDKLGTFLIANLFAINLLFGAGINVGCTLLAIFCFVYVWKENEHRINKKEKVLIFVFIAYFCSFLLSVLFHGDSVRILDRPSRVLFAIPILLVLININIKFKYICIGIVLGCFFSCFSGWIYFFYFPQYSRSFIWLPESSGFWYYWSSRFMHIQAGDMAVSLGMFSLIISIYYFRLQKYVFSLFCLLGFISAIIASVLSGARGGWVCIPVALVIILLMNSRNTKFIVCSILSLVLSIALLGKPIYDSAFSRLDSIRTEITTYGSSAGIRLELWKDALYTAKENPIFGIGTKNRGDYRIKHNKAGLISLPSNFNFAHAHNQYLEELSLRGVLGLFLLLALFLYPLWEFFNRNKRLKKIPTKVEYQQEAICQMGIVHIFLVMGYCLTQAYLEHNSGIMHYTIMLTVFFAMSHNKVHL